MVAAVAATAATLSAVSGYKAAQAQNKAAAYNAQVSEMEAASTLEAGQKDEARKRMETAQLVGRQKAVLAAQGVDIGSGTSLDIMQGTKDVGDMDAMTIRQNAIQRANALRTQASAFNSSKTNAGLIAATNFVSTAASVYSAGGGFKSSPKAPSAGRGVTYNGQVSTVM